MLSFSKEGVNTGLYTKYLYIYRKKLNKLQTFSTDFIKTNYFD